MPGQRTPEEIRASIEANRAELGFAVERLRLEVHEATNWRQHLVRHHQEAVIGAAGVGFVLGGGIGGLLGLFTRSK